MLVIIISIIFYHNDTKIKYVGQNEELSVFIQYKISGPPSKTRQKFSATGGLIIVRVTKTTRVTYRMVQTPCLYYSLGF